MTIISQTDRDFQRATDTVSIFLRTFHVASLLRAVGAAKQKGVAVMDIFRFILSNVFTGRSMYRQSFPKPSTMGSPRTLATVSLSMPASTGQDSP